MNKGVFHAVRIHDSKKYDTFTGLKVFGVRLCKFLPDDWVHWDGLTPSKKLLFASKDLEKKGEWNKDTFRNFYRPQFAKEMKNNDFALSELKKMYIELSKGNDVFYACYCKEHHLCHRSIIADFFESKGFSVIRS